MSVEGKFGKCCCAEQLECERRVSAIKEWNGWFAWDKDPGAEVVTTRYRTLTQTVSFEVSGEYFDGEQDWALIDPIPQPPDTVSGMAKVFPCPDGDLVYGWQSTVAPFDFVNVTYYPGGTWNRTIVKSWLRDQQGGYGYQEIRDEGFSTPVYTYDDPHPGGCCDAPTTYTDPTWATKPTPVYDEALAGWCGANCKYFLDLYDGVFNECSSGGTVSPGGLVKTYVAEMTDFPGSTTQTLTVVFTLSEPYTLDQAMADADALFAKIPLTGAGVTQKDCGGGDLTTGCGVGNSADSAIEEDWVCSASQQFRVSTMADAFLPDLDDRIRAARLWINWEPSGGQCVARSYILLIKSAFDCGAGTNIRTTPYTHSTNYVDNAGTPTDSDPDPIGLTAFNPPAWPTCAVLTNPA